MKLSVTETLQNIQFTIKRKITLFRKFDYFKCFP